eukprot:scaffold8938_cov213-Skeletonema_marinoi.AAC.1
MIFNNAYTCCTVFAVTSDVFEVEEWSRFFTRGRSGDPTGAVVDETIATNDGGQVASQCFCCSTLSNITALLLSRGCGDGGALAHYLPLLERAGAPFYVLFPLFFGRATNLPR